MPGDQTGELKMIETKAKLLAQSYLLEVIIGATIASQPDPITTINRLRFDLVAQLRADHQAGGPGFPSPDAETAVVESATDYLNQMFDRLVSQFETPPPHRHTA